MNEDFGGVLIQGNEEDLSLRPRPEKETLKIGRRRLYMQNWALVPCSYSIIDIVDYYSWAVIVHRWSFSSQQLQATFDRKV